MNADAIRQSTDDSFKKLQELRRLRPDSIVKKVIFKEEFTFAGACSGAYKEDHLVISHRWERPDHPDETGTQWRAVSGRWALDAGR